VVPCVIKGHFIRRYAELHTQIIPFILPNVKDFIPNNSLQKGFFLCVDSLKRFYGFDKLQLWSKKLCKSQIIIYDLRNDYPLPNIKMTYFNEIFLNPNHTL